MNELELRRSIVKWNTRLIKENDYPPFKKLINEFILDLEEIRGKI